MVRCDSAKDGRVTFAGISAEAEKPAGVSPATDGSVSSCGGIVRAMFEVNYAKYGI